MIDGVNALNRQLFERVGDAETNARIAQYEMAFRMQSSVPELADLSSEPQSTWDLYGEKAKEPGTYAYNCLMARRLAERGVRFTQIFLRSWDQHSNLPRNIKLMTEESDQPTAALVTDLKGCSTTRWSCGAGSSAGRATRRACFRRRTTAATITRAVSVCGWRAAA
jgi:hypothetical protein